ncbi:hypothetical protein K474DRAFT_1674449 [Panus rudis PR-1116 ss-1]|nr:hypothetical protein K474DRAFT_1674449 [Panus rudis PR-1116 ss-1]
MSMQALDTYAFAIVAPVALIIYDHLLTLDQEIACIWRRKMSFPSLLCLFNRYMLLFNALITGLKMTPWSGAINSSKRYMQPLTAVLLDTNPRWPGQCSYKSIAFSALRVYAIRQRSLFPAVLILLVNATWMSIGAILYSPMLKPLDSTSMYSSRTGITFLGCLNMPPGSPTIDVNLLSTLRSIVNIISDTSTLLAEVLTIAFTVHKTFQIRSRAAASGFKVPLSALLLRDGSLQFLTLFALDLLNIIQGSVSKSPSIVLSSVGIILSSLMFSHFFFHLRQVYLSELQGDSQTTSGSLSRVQFASVSMMGNVGAPLGGSLNSLDEEDEWDMEISNDPLAVGLTTSGDRSDEEPQSIEVA